MKLAKLSDNDLAKIAGEIDLENKRRNLKAAKSAIMAVLRKHKLVGDLSDLGLDQTRTKRAKKKTLKRASRQGKDHH